MNVDQYISSGVLELYALHALPADEMRKVEEMVRQNPRIRSELEAIEQGLIKYAEAHAQKPSEELYDKILNRIHELPNESQTMAQPVEEAPVISLESENPDDRETEEPVPFSDTRIKRLSGRYLMAVAASIILLIVSISFNYYQYNQYNDVKGQLAAAQQEKEVEADNNEVLQTKFDQTSSKLKFYTDPQNKMVMLKGMPISPESEVMIMWDTRKSDVYVDVHRLPVPPDGMQYQLWAIDKEGNPENAGLLTPYKERKEKGMEQMKEKITDAVAFAITLEQKGGATEPTMKRMYVKGGV